MSQNIFSPNDPKFTAYALGELDPAEQAEVEAALRDNPAARAAVEEIRATAGQLSAAFAAEPMVEAEPVGRAERAAVASSGDTYRKRRVGPLGKLIQFPNFYYVAGGFAAACFAVVVALREPQFHPAVQRAAQKAEDGKISFVSDLGPSPDAPASTVAASPTGATAAPEASETGLAIRARVEVEQPAGIAGISAERAVQSPTLLQQLKAEQDVAGTAPIPALANRSGPLLGPPIPSSAPVGPEVNRATELLLQVTDTRGAVDRVQPAAVPPNATGSDPVKRVPPNDALSVSTAIFSEKTQSAESASAGAVNTKLGGYQVSVDQESVNRLNAIPASAGGTASVGRAASAGGATPVEKNESERVLLTPFSVSTSGDSRGYFAGNSLAGSGLAVGPTEFRLPPRPRGDRFRENSETYAHTAENDFLGALQNPLSTFSIDVDTAAYANVRRFIEGGHLPPVDAVRIEEMVNYFSYDYAPPKNNDPFAASLEVASAPWAPDHRLVRIGLKGRVVSTAARPSANLVFLLDVSSSMNAPNKMPLVKEAMQVLVKKLRPDDRVAIVTYAGRSGMALPSTPAANAREIVEALNELSPAGSTNGAMGIQLAYDIAKANFVTDGINRVILCTDGDFNVGVSSEAELTRLIGEKAKSGVFLTVLGFGMGNLNDSLLEKLADKGNGSYGYIDTRREAEKLLADQVNGTLMTIAKDVKIQVEFNPAKVASYRLIGYENRLLRKEDFNNDAVDAGEIGAGHTVTALYEIVPVGVERNRDGKTAAVDPLKYQTAGSQSGPSDSFRGRGGVTDELLTVKVRYKKPNGIFSRKLEFPLVDRGASFVVASRDFKLAAAVAGFGMILRDSSHRGNSTLDDVVTWLGSETDAEERGRHGEFLGLVKAAGRLMRSTGETQR